MKNIIAECSLDGFLRYGHYEVELSDEEYENYSNMSESDKKRFIRNKGELFVDDYVLNNSYIKDIYEDED